MYLGGGIVIDSVHQTKCPTVKNGVERYLLRHRLSGKREEPTVAR
jgi:hypothetical protein